MLGMSDQKLGMLRIFFISKILNEICVFATINHEISFKMAVYRLKIDRKTILTNTSRPDFSFFKEISDNLFDF